MKIRIIDVRKGENRFAVTEEEGWFPVEFGLTKQKAVELARKYSHMRQPVTVVKGYSRGNDSYSVYIRK